MRCEGEGEPERDKKYLQSDGNEVFVFYVLPPIRMFECKVWWRDSLLGQSV